MTDKEPGGIGSKEGSGTRASIGRSASLEFPADPELWSIARLVVSAVASRLDFAVDELDDLRLSVDELCTLCAADAPQNGRIHLTVSWGPDTLEVACRVTVLSAGAAKTPAVRPNEVAAFSDADLSRRILGALVDEFEVTATEDGRSHGWFRKARVSARPQ